MMSAFISMLKDLATARDNESFSLTKLIATTAAVAMVYNFISTASQDFNGFGLGIAGMIAAMAAKYFVEKE